MTFGLTCGELVEGERVGLWVGIGTGVGDEVGLLVCIGKVVVETGVLLEVLDGVGIFVLFETRLCLTDGSFLLAGIGPEDSMFAICAN